MHSGSGRVLAAKQKSAVSVYVGIASLVLEGRALGGEDDDETFLRSQSPHLHHRNIVGNDLEVDNAAQSSSPSIAATTTAVRSSSGVGVINRISEKLTTLARLRQFPGTSRELDVVEASIAIPVHDEYERQPRLHHVASAREFQRNVRLTSIPASSASSSSTAASVLHDIDVDWNDISILFNGLDSIVNVPSFPLKLSSSPAAAHHLNLHHHSGYRSINQDSLSSRMMKSIGKTQSSRIQPEKTTTTCSSPSHHAHTLKPKQGPHCEKFLKKLGLLKFDSPESELDHMCNHVNSYCRRWQFHLKKLLQVLSKAEDACIEVYLGPENNAILLEQWIITLTDKPSTSSTMTIHALCSAIRSQLFFSQVSSWIDLLKKAFVDGDECFKNQMPSLFTSEVMQNPRLKKNLQTMQVNLDILFRVKSYDGTSCFNEKPNVHNFPDTIISDGLAICVCLKSLPRLEKIPTLNTEKAHLNGFSFFTDNNRLKSNTIAETSTSSNHLLHDRMATFSSCHEKGKHRCKEEEDEEEELHNIHHRLDSISNAMSSSSENTSSSSLTSTTASSTQMSGLSHRERQLLKYKKRLMKRDKQKKKQFDREPSPTAVIVTDEKLVDKINSIEFPLYQQQPPPQQPSFKDQQQQIDDEKDLTKSTAIVDSSLKSKSSSDSTSSSLLLVSTLSIATQTDFSSDASSSQLSMSAKCCDSCGNQLQCLNCDKIKKLTCNNYNQMAPPLAIVISQAPLLSSSVSTVSGTMVGNKANLLLQAIQRTANAHQRTANAHQHQHSGDDENLRDSNNHPFSNSKIQTTPRDISISSSTSKTAAINIDTMSDDCDNILMNNNNINNNNNNNNDNSVEISKESSDCRLCKRQKTKHNYSPSININASGDNANNNNNNNCYRRTMSECMVGVSSNESENDSETNSPNLLVKGGDGSNFLSMHNCDDLQLNSSNMSDDFLSYGDLKAYRRAFSEDVINQLPDEYDDDDVITIKCHHLSSNDSSQVHKLTPNVTLLNNKNYLPSTSNGSNLQSHQRIPKINLTQIFDNIQPASSTQSSHQQEINDSGLGHDSLDFSPTGDNVFIFNSPVKSYPPSTMQLSPGSLNKRRTRHISDRSSVSEYCSDEDDSVMMGKCGQSSKISSLYKKFVSKTQTAFNKFSKLPLIGNIEENLLHNRFQSKAIVDGFKLLLGASGSFCPTQLTIPAQTYFYEFHGTKHMSTPYVCDFRLTRKYSIPRSGTVQATLLNPQGTVVRMFFVPYDFRDMPAMSQTFMRQRVLAIDEHISQKNVEQMSTSEQMKNLRYVINLRFQTGRSGRLCLHTDIKLIISRRTEFDTAAAHAKNSLESPNDLKTIIVCPENPKFSSRIERN